MTTIFGEDLGVLPLQADEGAGHVATALDLELDLGAGAEVEERLLLEDGVAALHEAALVGGVEGLETFEDFVESCRKARFLVVVEVPPLCDNYTTSFHKSKLLDVRITSIHRTHIEIL